MAKMEFEMVDMDGNAKAVDLLAILKKMDDGIRLSAQEVKAKHRWEFDLPWHMVDIRDWFYMVNTGYIHPVHFLHVRILGVRSIWEVEVE